MRIATLFLSILSLIFLTAAATAPSEHFDGGDDSSIEIIEATQIEPTAVAHDRTTTARQSPPPVLIAWVALVFLTLLVALAISSSRARRQGAGAPVYQGLLSITCAADVQAARQYGEITGGLFIQISDGSNAQLELPNLTTLGGPLTITSRSGLRSLSLPALRQLRGTLSLAGVPAGFELHLPKLQSIHEGFSVIGTGFSALSLDTLQRIEGMLVLTNNKRLHTLSLPALESVGGTLAITDNPRLHTIGAPKLAAIHENFALSAPEMTTLALDALRTIGGGLMLSDLPNLQRLSLAHLRRVGRASGPATGSLVLSGFPNLADLHLPRLEAVKHDLIVVNSPHLARLELGLLLTVGGQLNITNNQHLQVIDLTALEAVEGDLSINNNPALKDLSITALKTSGDLRILNNKNLSATAVDAIVDQLRALGWLGSSHTINNRDDRPSS